MSPSTPGGPLSDPSALAVIETAIRAAWSVETADPVDRADWTPDNPARGQCGVTALVLHDLLGGELLIADVLFSDGRRQGVHYWNRLPDDREVDLTREQFRDDEHVQHPEVTARPPGLPRRAPETYVLLRERVLETLADVARDRPHLPSFRLRRPGAGDVARLRNLFADAE